MLIVIICNDARLCGRLENEFARIALMIVISQRLFCESRPNGAARAALLPDLIGAVQVRE